MGNYLCGKSESVDLNNPKKLISKETEENKPPEIRIKGPNYLEFGKMKYEEKKHYVQVCWDFIYANNRSNLFDDREFYMSNDGQYLFICK